MELKDIINEYKQKTGISSSEIARLTGVTRSTATRWSKGEIKRLSPEVMRRVSDLVGYNVEPLLKGMDVTLKLPVLGYVKGGYDLFAQENYIGEEDVSMSDKRRGDFYLQVTGNSMNGAGIVDGSLILVQKTDHIRSGEIGVVLIDDEVTVKKVVYKKNMMILEAANADVENRYFTAQEVDEIPVRVIGRVVSAKTYF